MGAMELLVAVLLVGASCEILVSLLILLRSRAEHHAAQDAARLAKDERLVAEEKLARVENERRDAERILHTAAQEQLRLREEHAAAEQALTQARLVAEEYQKRADEARQQAEQTLAQAEKTRQEADRVRLEAQQVLDSAREKEGRAEELTRIAEGRVKAAEQAQQDAEERMHQAELACKEATRRAETAERKQMEAEGRARSAEEQMKKLEQALHDAQLTAEEARRSAKEQVVQSQRDLNGLEERLELALQALRVVNESAVKAEEAMREAEAKGREAEEQREHVEDALRRKQAEIDSEITERKKVERALEQVRSDLAKAQRKIANLKAGLAAAKSRAGGGAKPAESQQEASAPHVGNEIKLEVTSEEQLEGRSPKRGDLEAEETSRESLPLAGLICFQQERQWNLAVSVPEELGAAISVHHDGESLKPSEFDPYVYQLNHAHGTILIYCPDSDAQQQIDLGDPGEDYILFKLVDKKKQKWGRPVGSLNHGAYLLVAPWSWEPVDALQGAEPEPVSLEGYSAYYYFREKDSRESVGFHDGRRREAIPASAERFELIGQQVPVFDREVAPIFYGEAPHIHPINEDCWKGIETVVVGEEGRGRKNWAAKAFAAPRHGDEELVGHIADLRGPWFFLRFYDEHKHLVESMDFRLVRGLQRLQVDAPEPLFLGAGNSAAHVEFTHTLECDIQPGSELEQQLQIDKQEAKTLIEIPAKSDYDETHFRIVSDRGEDPVDVPVLLKRIWWAVGDEGKEPDNWADKAITLRRDDLAATTGEALWVRFPACAWADRVRLGVDSGNHKFFDVDKSKAAVSIPLYTYRDTLAVQTIGVHLMDMVVYAQSEEYCGIPAEIIIEAVCKLGSGDLSTTRESEILEHIRLCHMDALSRPLTYEELRGRDPTFPSGLAVCPKCDYVAMSFCPQENVVDLIRQHIREMGHYVNGLYHFTEIHRVDEIRALVPGLNLPYVVRCRKCNYMRDLTSHGNAVRTEFIQHWMENHRASLYDIR